MKRVLHYESYGDICIVLRFKMVNLLVFYATFILDIWLWKISCLHLYSIWNPAGNSHFQWPMLAFACYPPTQRVPGDIGMGWVRASVRPCVRPCVRPSPPRSQRWLDRFSWYFAWYWPLVWNWCPSILFFDIIQNGRSAAIFNAHRNIFIICHHLNLRDGQTNFLEILHEIGTWYRVDADLFWFFKKFKMAAQRLFLWQNIAVLAFKHQELWDGRTDFHEILHEIGTWYRVDANLFQFFVKIKMATQRLFLWQKIAVLAFKHQELRHGWTDFYEILHEIVTLYRVDFHLFWFFVKFKMAAQRPFLWQNIAVLAFKHKGFTDGWTDFHKILHDVCTWCGVHTCLFWFFIKFKMAAQGPFLLQNVADMAF